MAHLAVQADGDADLNKEIHVCDLEDQVFHILGSTLRV